VQIDETVNCFGIPPSGWLNGLDQPTEQLARQPEAEQFAPGALCCLATVNAPVAPRTLAITLPLSHPAAQRFRANPELLADGPNGRLLRRMLRRVLQDHAHGTLSDFR
jgi:hypothetical protein